MELNDLITPAKKKFRFIPVRIAAQIFFFMLFMFFVWSTEVGRLGGYPVSRFLEIDPLVMLSTLVSTGYVYRYLIWGIILIAVTLLVGRVFCNWMCPYGTLHQFVGWLFNINRSSINIDKNRYKVEQYLKYSILIIFFIFAGLGALQIGLLDPICLMYRTVATTFAPAFDGVIDTASNIIASLGMDTLWLSNLKFAPGVDPRIFVGSFWVGIILLGFVGMNVIYPRFFLSGTLSPGCSVGRDLTLVSAENKSGRA